MTLIEAIKQNNQKEVEKVRHTYKFTIFIDDFEGVTIDMYKNAGWNVLSAKDSEGNNKLVWDISTAHEIVTAYILYKPTIQYQGFEVVENNLSILTDLEALKTTNTAKLFKFLGENSCSNECKSANALIRVTDNETKKKANKNICDVHLNDWILRMDEKRERIQELQGCVNKNYCKNYKGFLDNNIKNLMELQANKRPYPCKKDAILCT